MNALWRLEGGALLVAVVLLSSSARTSIVVAVGVLNFLGVVAAVFFHRFLNAS